MGAHLSFQVLAQVLHHKLGNEKAAINAVLEQMPFSLVQAMKKIIEHNPREKGQPACIKEMSSMLMILDGFSKRGILSKRKSHKPVIDWRIQLILDEVNAHQRIQPTNGGVSRFATSAY